MSGHACCAPEHKFFADVNVALDRTVYLGDRYVDGRFCKSCSRADDQSAVFRVHISRELTIDSQHRFKTDFT